MLRRLTVKNYAIIRELDMGFGEGFTVITGETGAGKSILLGALGLALGERADTSVLLSQDEKCVVEADFNVRGYELEGLFDDNGLDYDDDLVLRREITPAGKSRAFINDTPVTLNVMKELGTRLIDVHSQHQTLLLGNNMFQLRVIDAYAGASSLSGEYGNAWVRYLRARRAYDDAAGDAERERSDFDYYSHQLGELQAARLTEGEQELLEQEQERLTNAGEIKEALTTVTTALSGDGASAISLLRAVRNSLARISGWLPEAALLEQRIDGQLIDLNDISYEAEKLNSNTSDDPGRLEQVTARLDTIWSLMQKHRCRDLGELLSRQEQIAEKVSHSAGVDERITDLRKRADEAYAVVTELAGRLSAARREAVGPFTREITAMLKKLGMPHARFGTDLIPSELPGPSGAEKAEFMFSANRQVEPEELSRCASGGELSRVMLCLKSVLASSSGLPAIIFDEIDSGVSGEVASMVGDILEDMGRSMQVINITHLPQVASRGTLHYHVYKEESDHSTITRVRLLKNGERVQEIARLLSGSTVTEAAVRNARELLGNK